ncbi:MAG: Na/Pi symporter [Calditrichia bacterium]
MEGTAESGKSRQLEILEFILKIVALLFVLFLFFYSLDLMGASFKLLGKGVAKKLLETTSNPFAGLFIGVLVTSLIQSSSTTTSLTVGMVGGGLLPYHLAIPIIMGANIGTSITNTLVSIGSLKNNVEFKRAFSASIVHDFFNILTVLWIFPIQYFFNILEEPSVFLAKTFKGIGGATFLSPVKALTKPAAKFTLHLIDNNGIIGSIIAIIVLFIALRYLVKLLKLLIVGKLEAWFRRKLFKTAGRAFVLGILLTFLVQSSSITTSFIVPIVGAGILTLEQVFPFTLGANIGTTITAMLASMVLGSVEAMTVAFAHLLFNIMGILGIWKIQFIPIKMARHFAEVATQKKYIPFLYILVVFFIIPLSLIIITE